jgi:DNA-binding MarR family transcriptional regulator
MEGRGLVTRAESGASGRRTGVGLTSAGRRLVEKAVLGHARTIRRYFFDSLSAEQAAAIRAWSDQVINRVPAGQSEQFQ